MTFPFDGEQVDPAIVNLVGEYAGYVGCDYFHNFVLVTNPVGPVYYDASWIVASRLVLKRRPEDDDADAISTGEVYITDGLNGEGYLKFPRADLTKDHAGTLYYSWHASNGTDWIPMWFGPFYLTPQGTVQASP